MTGLSLRINVSCFVDLFPLMILRTFWRKDLTDAFDGFMSSFPLYFRMFLPRKSKPSSMCVISVFSSESCSPRAARNARTMGSTSFFSSSGDSPVIMKSSALCRNRHSADYTEVETMPKLSLKYRRYRGFLLIISA